MSLTLLYWVLIAIMLLGIVGAIVPGLPGSSLILAAILIWGIATGFANLTWPLITVTIVLLLSVGIDYLAAYWGAKRVGASSWSQIGAIVGLVLGFFGLLPALPVGGPILGLIAGPILGAFLGEFFYRRELPLGERAKFALKVCVGVVVGSLIGNFVQALLALMAVIVFIFNTWPPVLT